MIPQRPSGPPPCLVCGSEVLYLWKDLPEASNLDAACDITVTGFYGSVFDTDKLSGSICDSCVQKAVDSGRLRLTAVTL